MPRDIDGEGFLCRNLENCEVQLFDLMSSLYIINCRNCKFYLGPVNQSIFVRKCKDIVLVSAS